MKSIFKVVLLPSVLAVSLIISACQDASSLTENEVRKSTETTSENSSQKDHANPDMQTVTTAELSAEQRMINNLARYRWVLLNATDSNAQPLTSLIDIKDQVTLLFNQNQGQNTISYSVGCNTMSAAYQLQGHTLTTEDSMSTKMSCGDLNVAENDLNQWIQGRSQLSIVGGENPTLTQALSDSTTLVWSGELTAQAKYTGKGKTVFWAVNSETKPCVGNSMQRCLQVKPITYNDQGVKISEGEWTLFAGNIDGYQHDGTHNEVLRLQQYKLDDDDYLNGSASDEGPYAYMLDAVIESEVVR